MRLNHVLYMQWRREDAWFIAAPSGLLNLPPDCQVFDHLKVSNERSGLLEDVYHV